MLDDRRFYRPREVVLETHAPRSLVYDALRSGDLRAIRRGRGWLIPGSAASEWVDAQARERPVDLAEKDEGPGRQPRPSATATGGTTDGAYPAPATSAS